MQIEEAITKYKLDEANEEWMKENPYIKEDDREKKQN